MKKLYLLNVLMISLLIFTGFNSYGQNILIGSDMEIADEASWSTSELNQDANNEVTYEFGSTDETPSFGTDGCLYISGTNTGTAGGQLTNFMFYQEVTLQRGVNYIFDGAYLDFRTNNYWCEVYYGGNEPAVGSDYGGGEGAVLVSGFKSTNWEASCPSDQFDGTFLNDACISEATNPFMIEGDGDTTVYFGFRMGIWDDQSNGYSFEVMVDNITLTPFEESSVKNQINDKNLLIYPSPIMDYLNIELATQIQEVNLVNPLGQTILSNKAIDSEKISLDVSGINKGMYFIIIKDINGNVSVTKTVKI